jgi:hypothetical protein
MTRLLWCSGCTTDKPEDEFALNRHHRGGRANRCKACLTQYAKSPRALKLRVVWRQDNLARSLLIECRTRAKKRGVAFDLTADDLVIPKVCPVLGIELGVAAKTHAQNSPSVDRIDPSQGYIKGNIAIISWKANRLKSDCDDPEVFEAIAAYIRRGRDAPDRPGVHSASLVRGVPQAQGTLGLHRSASQGG